MLNKLDSNHIITTLVSLLQDNRIIHISGDPGTGKSILAQTIAIEYIRVNQKQALYIDTMKKFSKKRFLQFFKDNPERDLFSITEIHSLQAQEFLINKLKRLSDVDKLQDIGLIIFDSISHNLRDELTKGQFTNYLNTVNGFHAYQIEPLVRISQKHDIRIIFVHEMSYKPGMGTIPFLFSYFEQVTGLCLPTKKIVSDEQKSKPSAKSNANSYVYGNNTMYGSNYVKEMDKSYEDYEDCEEYEGYEGYEDYEGYEGYDDASSFNHYQYDSESEFIKTVVQIPSYNDPDNVGVIQVPFKIGDSGLKFLF